MEVKIARIRKGLTGRELAKKLDVSFNTIYRIENGQTLLPNTKVLKGLCRELGKTPQELFPKRKSYKKNKI